MSGHELNEYEPGILPENLVIFPELELPVPQFSDESSENDTPPHQPQPTLTSKKRRLQSTGSSGALQSWLPYLPARASTHSLFLNRDKLDEGLVDFQVTIDKNSQNDDEQPDAVILYRQNQFAIACEFLNQMAQTLLDQVNAPTFTTQSPNAIYLYNGTSLVRVEGLYFSVYAIKHFKDSAPPLFKTERADGTVEFVEDPTPILEIGPSRSKKDAKPPSPQMVMSRKTVFSRLQFQNATLNNARASKEGTAAMQQQYFRVVVVLHAAAAGAFYTLKSKLSPPLVVRGQNPGRYTKPSPAVSPDQASNEAWRQTTASDGVSQVTHSGRVGINVDCPREALAVDGNVLVTGTLLKPSDQRLKSNIEPVDTREQLDTIINLQIYDYDVESISGERVIHERGVLAQELRELLPSAVENIGDIKIKGRVIPNLLVVNDRLIALENVGATQELYKYVQRGEQRMDELTETMSKFQVETQEAHTSVSETMNSLVEWIISEDNSDDFCCCFYCSCCGMGTAWSLFVLGLFIPFFWLFGAFYVFSLNPIKRAAGICCTVMVIVYSLSMLAMYYWGNIFGGMVMPLVTGLFGFGGLLLMGWFYKKKQQKKAALIGLKLPILQFSAARYTAFNDV